MPTFGTRSNPAHYVEVPDPSNPGQVKRPNAADIVLSARSYPEGVALPDITVGEFGYWDAIFDVNAITVSGDDGATWVGPLFSAESLTAAINAGLDVDTALAQSAQALAAAQEALRIASQGGGGGGGPITIEGYTATNFTLDQINARDKRETVPVDQIEGLADVARSNSFRDLDDVPSLPIMVGGKVQAINLPSDGTFDRPIRQNADGTYPARNVVSSDPTRRIYYDQTYNLPTFPAVGPNPDTAYLPDPANGIPGDAIFRHGAP